MLASKSNPNSRDVSGSSSIPFIIDSIVFDRLRLEFLRHGAAIEGKNEMVEVFWPICTRITKDTSDDIATGIKLIMQGMEPNEIVQKRNKILGTYGALLR